MSADGSSVAAAEGIDKSKQDGTGVMIAARMAGGDDPEEGGEAGTAVAVTNQRWHVENYMK